jgi:hypothetical protein
MISQAFSAPKSLTVSNVTSVSRTWFKDTPSGLCLACMFSVRSVGGCGLDFWRVGTGRGGGSGWRLGVRGVKEWWCGLKSVRAWWWGGNGDGVLRN